ncbi:hypothetical protein AB0M95_16005 [Sphaerisporangium sp. NPDC051017]|uniref:hypothetical protein n=1 Tax=Sphaerisporangium sp. NPDC051017 TaxID=3154636 RepID=UPI0034200920
MVAVRVVAIAIIPFDTEVVQAEPTCAPDGRGARHVEILHLRAQREERRRALVRERAVGGQVDGEVTGHAPGIAGQDDDPPPREDRFLDVMGHHDHGCADVPPHLADEHLHVLFRLNVLQVQRVERLVQRQ